MLLDVLTRGIDTDARAASAARRHEVPPLLQLRVGGEGKGREEGGEGWQGSHICCLQTGRHSMGGLQVYPTPFTFSCATTPVSQLRLTQPSPTLTAYIFARLRFPKR
jgi:hypothetical protein